MMPLLSPVGLSPGPPSGCSASACSETTDRESCVPGGFVAVRQQVGRFSIALVTVFDGLSKCGLWHSPPSLGSRRHLPAVLADRLFRGRQFVGAFFHRCLDRFPCPWVPIIHRYSFFPFAQLPWKWRNNLGCGGLFYWWVDHCPGSASLPRSSMYPCCGHDVVVDLDSRPLVRCSVGARLSSRWERGFHE
jgi:hypothetical protein